MVLTNVLLKNFTMKLIFLLLSMFFGFTSGAQVETEINDPKAITRKIDASFSAISVSDGIRLYLSEGASESVAVSFSDVKYEDRSCEKIMA